MVLLHRIPGRKDCWEVLVRPGSKAKPGAKILFGEGELTAEVLETTEGGNRMVHLMSYEGELFALLDRIGNIPLPPYIHERLEEPERYQTVYAREKGSAAAPTAGLHFTEELLEKIKSKGVKVANITLHVGLGTFRPMKTETVEDHIMHEEYFHIGEEAADTINSVRRNKGRIIAVGTTSCRTLESVADESGFVKPFSGATDIFIYPGYRFKATDALITNFHLPQSSLIMLVCAFAGKESVMGAYQTAIDERYRFFSFGDAMFIY
jgi:S-adenosylmethionine:tRNA ribosyltransferase-isomerase